MSRLRLVLTDDSWAEMAAAYLRGIRSAFSQLTTVISSIPTAQASAAWVSPFSLLEFLIHSPKEVAGRLGAIRSVLNDSTSGFTNGCKESWE